MWQRLPYQISFNIAFFHKSTYPAPHSSMSSILGWTDHLQQSSKSTLPIPQYTTIQLLSCNPVYLPHSFPLSPHWVFKLGQGNYALSGQQGTWVFSEGEDIHLHYICLQGQSAQKPERSALILVPGFSFSLIISYCQEYMKSSSLLHMYHP